MLHFDQRQAMAVGRHQRQALGPENELRAVEEVARVLAGDRELRLRDHLPHCRSRQRRACGSAGIRQRRKVLARQRLHARVESVRRYFDAVAILFDPNVGFGKRLHDLVELLRRQRQRSALCHSRLATAAQRDFEIGREHADLIALRFDQHVGEDGNGVLPLDDALEKLQFSQKLILPDNEFHRLCGDLEQSRSAALTEPAWRVVVLSTEVIRRDRELYKKEDVCAKLGKDY